MSDIDKNIFVMGDHDLLIQLVMIFLDNAIKYTKQNGTITVSAGMQPKVKLTIHDTGVGISQENQKKIFERFYQVDSSRASSGNGLGLAIAQEIVSLHKAKVSIESTLGKGSTFSIIFS